MSKVWTLQDGRSFDCGTSGSPYLSLHEASDGRKPEPTSYETTKASTSRGVCAKPEVSSPSGRGDGSAPGSAPGETSSRRTLKSVDPTPQRLGRAVRYF